MALHLRALSTGFGATAASAAGKELALRESPFFGSRGLGGAHHRTSTGPRAAHCSRLGRSAALTRSTRSTRVMATANTPAAAAETATAAPPVQRPTLSRAVSGKLKPIPKPERDFSGTEYIPIYVMLPLNTVSMDSEVVDPVQLYHDLRKLKEGGVDGVMVDVWWGIVERRKPQQYNWEGYRHLFQLVQNSGLKLQVVMSFHRCGGNVGDDVTIPLPQWILDLGDMDIFFNDRAGRPNTECLSWGVDKERVLAGRTGLEVYYDMMRGFRQEFHDLFTAGLIEEVEVGLGACGELRYPSYPESMGWKYPGIGEFVCYDKYLLKSLEAAAEQRGHPSWGQPPDNAGTYNCKPHETGFYTDDGLYDGFYGRFFLKWYSNTLIEHGDRVLTLAALAFEGTKIACKVSGIHWWYKTASHAAELTAGFYNTHNRDGYAPLVAMMAKHNATFNFTCVELRTTDQEGGFPEACADPEGLVWQVLNAAWEAGVHVASENALPCYDRQGYEKILANAKPADDPDGHHLAAFTYLRLTQDLFKEDNWGEFTRFVERLHGSPTSNN